MSVNYLAAGIMAIWLWVGLSMIGLAAEDSPQTRLRQALLAAPVLSADDAANDDNSANDANDANGAHGANDNSDAADKGSGRSRQIAAIQQLVLEHPGYHLAQYNLGVLLYQEADYEAAAAALRQATEAADLTIAADAWHNIALCEVAMGRLQQAISAARQAQRLMPDDPDRQEQYRRLRQFYLQQQEAARLAKLRALQLVPIDIPPAWVGKAFSHQLQATGGDGGPYTIALAADADLPGGLVLDADGHLHGTPTVDGTREIALVVLDGAEGKATGAIELQVFPSPAVEPDRLPAALLGENYQTELTAVGFITPQWQVSGLPPGFTFSPTTDGRQVTIAGRTAKAGTFSLSIQVSDQYHQLQVERTLVVEDVAALLAISQLPPGTQYQPFSHRLTWRGDRQQVTVAMDEAADATHGLTLRPGDMVAGTPAVAGPHNLTVIVEQPNGSRIAQTLDWEVNLPPLISEDETINIQQGQALKRQLQVENGTPPYRWQLLSGTLPRGVSLSEDGRLVGSAEEPGASECRIQVEDRWGAQHQQSMTIQVTAPEENNNQENAGDKNNEESEEGGESEENQQGDQSGEDDQSGEETGDQENNSDQGDQTDSGNQQNSGNPENGENGQDAANQLANGKLTDQQATDEQQERLSRGGKYL